MSKRIPPHVILGFVPEEGITAVDLKEKLSYLYVDVISTADIELSMQSALEQNHLILGDKLKLFAFRGADKYRQIRTQVNIINDKMITLQNELKEVREKCDHQGDLTYTYYGSSGNYDPSADCYWIDWHCKDCGKRWSTSQENSGHLTRTVYPNAKQIKKY